MIRKTYSREGVDFNYLSNGRWEFKAAHKSENFTFICKTSGFELAERVACQVSASLVRSLTKNNKLQLDGIGRVAIKNLCG